MISLSPTVSPVKPMKWRLHKMVKQTALTMANKIPADHMSGLTVAIAAMIYRPLGCQLNYLTYPVRACRAYN